MDSSLGGELPARVRGRRDPGIDPGNAVGGSGIGGSH